MKAIIVLLVILGCKERQTPEVDSQKEIQEFEYQKLPKKLEVSAEAATILNEWPEFMAFNSSVDVLYKSTNNEDLSLAIDDLLEKEKELSASTYPEPFDSFQIKSRQRVFRTLLLKVKANVLNKSGTTETTIELLEAYNIIRQQFNSILSSQLDTKLILDEEE
ncbi:hypothetical protein ACOKFD_14285 [Flagellimonas sp. S174]|uniref:hypothetical protein n=1 Tax=Flagellimonas sp. S174 TaxID=3410790 RepID=UPI002618D7D1|nr:hypothetical protein [uncultured Allomuricauda sp.]